MDNFRNNLYYPMNYDQELNEGIGDNIKAWFSPNSPATRLRRHEERVEMGNNLLNKPSIAAGTQKYGNKKILGNKIGGAKDNQDYMKQYGQVRKQMHGETGHKLYGEQYDFHDHLFIPLYEDENLFLEMSSEEARNRNLDQISRFFGYTHSIKDSIAHNKNPKKIDPHDKAGFITRGFMDKYNEIKSNPQGYLKSGKTPPSTNVMDYIDPKLKPELRDLMDRKKYEIIRP